MEFGFCKKIPCLLHSSSYLLNFLFWNAHSDGRLLLQMKRSDRVAWRHLLESKYYEYDQQVECLKITVDLFFWIIRQKNILFANLCFCVHIFIVMRFFWKAAQNSDNSPEFSGPTLPPEATSPQNDQDSTAVVAVPSSSWVIHLPVWSSLGCTLSGLYCSLYCCVLI